MMNEPLSKKKAEQLAIDHQLYMVSAQLVNDQQRHYIDTEKRAHGYVAHCSCGWFAE